MRHNLPPPSFIPFKVPLRSQARIVVGDTSSIFATVSGLKYLSVNFNHPLPLFMFAPFALSVLLFVIITFGIN
jgi:hypothetical protein